MNSTKRPINVHDNYHAHVYFDKDTFEMAMGMCEKVKHKFSLRIGNTHTKLVGPHKRWSRQIEFSSTHFDKLVPWLEQYRDGLTILVHGLTGNDLKDHTEYAYWLGESVELDLKGLDR